MTMVIDGTNGVQFPDSSIQTGAIGRNRIINGAMVIDQRNAGASVNVASGAGNIYTVDRWAGVTSGGTVAYQRVAGIGNYQNAIQLTGGASVTQAQLFQRIESYNIADCASQTVTVSFTAKSTTLTTLNVLLVYPTAGQDNWGSGYTNISTATITINSTATGYSANFSLPSNVTNGLGVIFYTGSFTSGTLTITGVQLEKGSAASPFEYRPYGQELALCQRYCTLFSVTAINTFFGSGFSYSSVNALAYTAFPVPMRTSPTVTYSNVSHFGVYDGSAGTIVTTALTAYSSSPNAIGTRATVASGLTAGQGTMLKDNGNTSATIICSAEL